MLHSAWSNVIAFARFITSRKSIPVFKAVLAYILVFILIFLRKFDQLSKFPATFTSMTIVVLVGAPGKAVGACVQSTGLALIGVGMGSVCFLILAKLVHSPVAQGFVFAAMVYVFALLKARGIKWFACALLAILVSFNGIYTSMLVGKFESAYLEEYIKAYCWAAAIVLFVNICIMPISSEKELRRTLILSLEHITTFSHLLGKSYTLEITEDERVVRDHLAQSIRADFGYLTQKIEETSVEINYSKFSMDDYQGFVARTRGIQLALITMYSSILNVEKKDLDVFRVQFLPNTVQSFTFLRKAIRTTIREIIAALGCKAMDISDTQAGYAEFMDVERQGSEASLALRRQPTTDEQLNFVSERLAKEVDDAARPPTANTDEQNTVSTPVTAHTRVGSIDLSQSMTPSGSAGNSTSLSPGIQTNSGPSRNSSAPGACVHSLRTIFDKFAADQHDILTKALISGKMHGEDDTLRVKDPLPSLQDIYKYRLVASSKENANSTPHRRRTWTSESDAAEEEGSYYEVLREKTHQEKKADEMATASHHSLARVYSFIFATEQFISELEQLYKAANLKSKRRIHVHIFERLHRPQSSSRATSPSDKDLGASEALALLERKPYMHKKLNNFQRLEHIELWLRGPTSTFAAKTAAAATIFAVLILHPVPRPWFISFGLSSGALTIVTALTPTLGQSILAFILQILGSGFGYIWALTILEMFRNVGGYHYNPFGIAALLVPYAVVFLYIFYEVPQYFVAALLALNGTGTVLIVEWINVEYVGNIHYDSPPLRLGKAFTTLGIALTIAAFFQLFILRNPARRTLRKRIGTMLFSQLSYATLLQAYARAAMPADACRRAPEAALERVERELQHRELKLQADLISLRPLVAFAAAEPQFSRPFRTDIINRVLRTSQIILDRMRESRTAINTKPLPEVVLLNFVRHLTPYRRRNSQLIQLAFYLIASSVMSKSPLPRETPAELESVTQTANVMHDILMLSSQHARTEEGAKTIRTGDFTRYFHYLVGISSLAGHLKTLEEACRELFGELEDNLV